jgi:hypothetical protein
VVVLRDGLIVEDRVQEPAKPPEIGVSRVAS